MHMSKPEKKPLVPALRFPEFQNAGEWEKKKLGEFLEESRVLGNKGDIARKITVKLWGKGVYEKNETIEGSINTQYYYRKAGQFIYSKLDFLNQAFGIIPDYLDGYESTVDLPCFDIKENLHPIFLLEYVKQKGFYEKQGEAADGSRKAKRIHADIFLSFPIFTPVKEEQQKIADCLSSIDDLITAQTQKLAALKAHKKGLMQQLFPAEGETVPKLRFPEFRDGGEWESEQLGNIGKVSMCKRIMKHETSESGDIPFYKIGTFGKKADAYISKEIYDLYRENFSFPKAGDILISASGTIGRTVVFDGKPAYFQDSNIVWIDNDGSLVSNAFLVFIYQKIKWVTDDNTIARLYNDNLRKIEIIIPPTLEEQKKIADCLDSIDELITAQNQKIEALKSHKKGLMQQLFPSMDEVDG